MNKVFISGLGVVSSIGVTLESFWDSLEHRKNGLSHQELNSEPIPYAQPDLAAFDQLWPGGWRAAVDRSIIKKLDDQGDATKYALCAVRAALENAGYSLGDLRDREANLYVGTSSANFGLIDEAFRGKAKMTGASHQQPATYIAMNEGFAGERFTVTNACTSSSDAIGLAYRAIRDHQSDLAIAVGTEGGFIQGRLLMARQRNLQSNGNIRPFDRRRDGTVFGEGAAALVLSAQPPEHGPLIEVVGYTSWCGGTHPMNAESSMIERCLRAALDRSAERFDPERDIFSPNASGTLQGDRAMAEAMLRVFGEPTQQPVSYFSRPLHGHLVGAVAAVEAVGLILAMQHRLLPTSSILEPEFDWIKPSQGQPLPDTCLALKVSVGLGGNYSCLMLKRSS